MIRVAAAGVLSCTLLLAGCDSDRRAISRDDLPHVPDEADVVVVVGSGGFDADELMVETDDLIEFVIDVDEVRITAEAPDTPLIDTGVLLRDESTFLILDRPGTYEFRIDDADEVTLRVESVEARTVS